MFVNSHYPSLFSSLQTVRFKHCHGIPDVASPFFLFELASSGLRDGVTHRSPHVLILDFGMIYISWRRRKALYDFDVYFTSFLVYGVNQALITRFYPAFCEQKLNSPSETSYCPEVLIFTPAKLLACYMKRRKCPLWKSKSPGKRIIKSVVF